MKKIIVLFTALLYTTMAYAQDTFKAIIKDAKTNETLVGATALIEGINKGATADATGLITLTGIPTGKQVIRFSYIGYQTRQDTLTFPLTQAEPISILLQPKGKGDGEE